MSNDNQISRRTLVKGAAWSVPAVMVATAAPAVAASPTVPEIAGTACRIYFGDGNINGQRTQIYLNPVTSDGAMKAGDVITYNFTTSRPIKVPTGTTSASCSIALSPPSGTSTTSFTVTLTALADNATSLSTCGIATPSINWDDSIASTSNPMIPKTVVSFTSTGTRDGKPTGGSGSLSFTVPQRYPTSVNQNGRTPVYYNSRGGLQETFPETRFSVRGNVDRLRNCGVNGSGSSVVYPDGACVALPTTTPNGVGALPPRA
ncbi:hypothetical protein [Corynebacterium atrinae]|uniref:hypothetical protein n=1 Tax=Corynebacterium atrinae TaxID=1336740 RepID=UPI0025B2B02E|nr:hypothetical protein [Corynebacterium atrinae]